MKKAFLIILFLPIFFFAQQISEQDDFKGKIKSVETKTYTVAGDQVSSTHNYYSLRSYGLNGKLEHLKNFGNDLIIDSEEVNFFNSTNQLIKTEIKMNGGRLDKIIYYEYNPKGNLCREIKTNTKNENEYETKYQYNPNLLLETKSQKFFNIDYEIVERYLYNTQNQLLEAFKETHSGISKDKFTYNSKGFLLSKDEFNAKNELFSTTLYEYNDNGDRISLIKTNLDGEVTYYEQYEYVYDTKQNWTTKDIYIKGIYSIQEKRILSYY